MTFSTMFSKPIIYNVWFIISAIVLVTSYFIEPYLFAYLVFGTIGLSIALFLVSLFSGWRPILLAIICFIPPAIAYVVMKTINWA